MVGVDSTVGLKPNYFRKQSSEKSKQVSSSIRDFRILQTSLDLYYYLRQVKMMTKNFAS